MKLIARATLVAISACLAGALPAQAADKFPSRAVHMVIPSADPGRHGRRDQDA
jgi:hypothetical protein